MATSACDMPSAVRISPRLGSVASQELKVALKCGSPCCMVSHASTVACKLRQEDGGGSSTVRNSEVGKSRCLFKVRILLLHGQPRLHRRLEQNNKESH